MKIDRPFFDGHKIPKPLSREEMHDLLQKASEGSQESRDTLITHNIRLVLYEVANKFHNVDYDKEDLVSTGIIGLVKAIDTYDISKGVEFSSFAIRVIDNEILMFLRKLRKDYKVESIESVFYRGNDGKELKLEEKLCSDDDLVEDYEKKEACIIIRELVKKLPDRDREIIMMRFGFYNDRIYSQQEISDKLNISQSYVCRLIDRIVKKLGMQLEGEEAVEPQKELKAVVQKEDRIKMRKLQTIYEYFSDYTREQVDEMLSKLSDEEREILTSRYGDDLDNPKQSILSKEDSYKFYALLIPKMRKILSNPNYEYKRRKRKTNLNNVSKVSSRESKLEKEPTSTIKINSISGEINKDYCVKMLELLRTPTFAQMINMLTVKEAIIISLKLGYVDGKYFSTESIAHFLGVEENEVIETTKKALLLYKENINSFLDSIIEVATDQVNQDTIVTKGQISM